MGWSVGFTGNEFDAPDVCLAQNMSFPAGMRWLEAHIKSILDNMREKDNTREEYEALLADIGIFRHDPGIMHDPDMWEDMDFCTEDLTFWIVEN